MTSFSGFGEEYEKKISTRRAASLVKICGLSLPRLGYEITLADAIDDHGIKSRLYLQNHGGSFVLASSTWPVVEWGRVFKHCFASGRV